MTELCTADDKVGVLQFHVSEVVDVALAVLQYTVDTEVKVALSAAVAGHVLRLAKIVHTTQAIVLSDEFDPRPTLAERTAAPLILRASLTCFQRARVQGGSECLIEVATRLEPARAAPRDPAESVIVGFPFSPLKAQRKGFCKIGRLRNFKSIRIECRIRNAGAINGSKPNTFCIESSRVRV